MMKKITARLAAFARSFRDAYNEAQKAQIIGRYVLNAAHLCRVELLRQMDRLRRLNADERNALADHIMTAEDQAALKLGRRILVTEAQGGMMRVDLLKHLDKKKRITPLERVALINHLLNGDPVLVKDLIETVTGRMGWTVVYAVPPGELPSALKKRTAMFQPGGNARN